MNNQSDVANNALPLLPPKKNLETTEILNQTIKAARELAKLKGYCTLLPNESILTDIIKETRSKKILNFEYPRGRIPLWILKQPKKFSKNIMVS